MSSNSKTSVSKAQNEQHKKILSQLLKLEGNRRCCDCSARGPTWASVNLGLFVCLNCSGIHRSLGTHLSKVRSTTLDTWLPEQVEFISKLGNARANAYWEARLPSGFRRPTEGDMSGLKVFITDKYQNQNYVSTAYDSPPNIDNYFTHPFMREADAGQASSPTVSGQTPQMPDRAAKAETSSSSLASLGQRATSPPPAASSRGATAPPRKPTPPPTATAQVVPTAPQMMDLLSLEDAAAPAQPASGDADGDWAAFVTASANEAAPQGAQAASSNAPAAAAGAAGVFSQDSWDAFQSGGAAPITGTAGSAAFDPFGSSQASEASLLSQFAQPAAAGAQAAPSGIAAKHVPKKSADDIMKMFDTPQQNMFAQAQFPAQTANGTSQQHIGALGGLGGAANSGMMQNAMYGMTPQQVMQLQQMYAAQGMHLPGFQQGGLAQYPAQPSVGGRWTTQQGAVSSFVGLPQQFQRSMSGPKSVPH